MPTLVVVSPQWPSQVLFLVETECPPSPLLLLLRTWDSGLCSLFILVLLGIEIWLGVHVHQYLQPNMLWKKEKILQIHFYHTLEYMDIEIQELYQICCVGKN
jgi:hypothetical protein